MQDIIGSNEPVCTASMNTAWRPVTKDFLPNRPTGINDIAWRRARAQQYQRCRLSATQPLEMMQGGAATEQTDNLAMNLRQAERELVIRDEETRRLRSALVHLEHTLSQREREFHDAVLCLQGGLPPSPPQPWLQKGVPSVELRLQVHRLQRSVAAKQDHIDHLNRQASLGFLREAREQAKEYRLEARRLARILTTATGSIRNGPHYPDADADPSQPPATGIKAPVHYYDTRGYQEQVHVGSEGTVYTPKSSVPGFLAKHSSHVVCTERGMAIDPVLGASSNTNDNGKDTNIFPELSSFGMGATWPLLMQQERARRARGSAAWESNGMSSPPRSVQWRHQGTRRWSRSPPLHSARRPYSADVCGPIPKAAPTTAPAKMEDGPSPWIMAGAGTLERHARPSSCHRQVWESGGGRYPPVHFGGLTGNQRTGRMADTARLRLSARKNAAERSQALAVDAESRRLQKARARRAHRMRLAQEKIARYRTKRLRELDARLNRRFNNKLQAPIEGQITADVKDRAYSTHMEATGHCFDDDQKLHPSKPRRDLETTVAMAESSQSLHDSNACGQDADEKRRSMERRESNSSRGSNGASGGGDGRRASARTLGKPPLPPSRVSRFSRTTRRSKFSRERVVDSDPHGNDHDGYYVHGHVWGDVNGDTWDYEDDADEVKTEAASDGGEVTDELWGDELEGGEIDEGYCTWDAPRDEEENEHWEEAWPSSNRGRFGSCYGGTIDDAVGEGIHFQDLKRIAARGVNLGIPTEFSSASDAHDRSKRVDIARSPLRRGNTLLQQSKAPSWDESTTSQDFGGVRSDRTNPSQTTPNVYSRRVKAFLTSDIDMSLHGSGQKAARRAQYRSNHAGDNQSGDRGAVLNYKQLEGFQRKEHGFGGGSGERLSPLREEDQGCRDSFELEAPPAEGFKGTTVATGYLQEEKQVVATDEGLDGEEMWEDAVTSARTQSNGQTLRDPAEEPQLDLEGGSYISPRTPSVANTTSTLAVEIAGKRQAPMGVGGMVGEGALAEERITGDGVQAPEYLDGLVNHSDYDGDDNRSPNKWGGSIFAISPSSDEEIAAFQTSNINTNTTSPSQRRSIHLPETLPESTTTRVTDHLADGVSGGKTHCDASRQRSPDHLGSRSNSFDQRLMSPSLPRLSPGASWKEEAVVGGITDDAEGVMSVTNDENLREKNKNMMASAPSLHNSTPSNSASLYNLSPDISLPNDYPSTPSLVTDAALACAGVTLCVNDQIPPPVREEIHGDLAEKALQSASSLPTLSSDSSRHFLASEVDAVSRMFIADEMAPVVTEGSHNGNVVPSASMETAKKMAGSRTESALSFPHMSSDSSRGALSRVVETQLLADSSTENDLETSVRNENASTIIEEGSGSASSVPPVSFHAGSSVDGGCSLSHAADITLDLEDSSVDNERGEAQQKVVQADTRISMDGEETIKTEERLSSSGDGSELDVGGTNAEEDDGYF